MEKPRVIILGSGTCVPSLKRSSCSVLIMAAQGNILLDCGPGTLHQLLRAGLKITDIDAVLLSHFHPDHSSELAGFVFATKYPEFKRQKKLYLGGGPGFSAFFDRLNLAY